MADYIKRESVMKILEDHPVGSWWWWRDVYTDNVRAVMREVEELPAADVAPVRHGKWEQCFEDWRKQIEGDKCSCCGFEHYGTSIKNYLYCPNCGAKMEGRNG